MGAQRQVEAARFAFYVEDMNQTDDGSERQRPSFWKRVQAANEVIWWISFLAVLLSVLVTVLVSGS